MEIIWKKVRQTDLYAIAVFSDAKSEDDDQGKFIGFIGQPHAQRKPYISDHPQFWEESKAKEYLQLEVIEAYSPPKEYRFEVVELCFLSKRKD